MFKCAMRKAEFETAAAGLGSTRAETVGSVFMSAT